MRRHLIAACLALAVLPARASSFTMAQALAFPFVNELVAARSAERIAWVRTVKGVRNVWVASGPAFVPVQVTRYTQDDGQELTQLALSPDGSALVYVRGGDHDANWPGKGDLPPQPTSMPGEPKIELWAADVTGRKPPTEVGEGDAPTLSSKNVLAFVKQHRIWTARLDGTQAHALFFDRGADRDLAWSPDGGRLAFVSNRDDHSFVGVYSDATHPLIWLAPSTGLDGDEVWSPDGKRIAYTRRRGKGGAPEPYLMAVPHPWAIWTADAATGASARVWASPATLRGSYPDAAGGANLHWARNEQLTFLANLDNWPHLYAVAAAGGKAKLLTPGNFMVEHVAANPDGNILVYSANAGTSTGDDDRRHLFQVRVNSGGLATLNGGEGLDWTPALTPTAVAWVHSDPRHAPMIHIEGGGAFRRTSQLVNQAAPTDFLGAYFLTPRQVTFQSANGFTIHGQLFDKPGKPGRKKPALIYVHGGPPRQMLLGWHYMDYYNHDYAINQWLADQGYTVLSVNYRLGIGYGYDFQHPPHAGPAGASEYQDVQAGARWLAAQPEVDPKRIGIWGGSYGGYLTALALARDSATFAAGVDLHGVHDWTRTLADDLPPEGTRFEKGDRAQFLATAWASSPDADVARWTSPVLLIHGDDDRNVRFGETIDLARRLEAKGVHAEELVLPTKSTASCAGTVG